MTFLKKPWKPFLVITFDGAVAATALWLAILLRYDFNLPEMSIPRFTTYAVVYALLCMGFYITFNLHKSMWRYTTARDLVRFCYATLFALILGALFIFILTDFTYFPRSALVILPLLQIALSSAPRVVFRLWHDKVFQTALTHQQHANNALLIGVGDSADLFVRECQRQKNSPYKLVGAIDFTGELVGRMFHGLPVFDNLDGLVKTLTQLEKKNHPVNTLILSDIQGASLKKVIEIASSKNIQIKRIPSVSNLKDGTKLTDLKPVMIEDLLGRESVHLDNSSIEHLLKNKPVLVTGAGGSIGQELCRQIAEYTPKHLLLLDHSEDALYHVDMEFSKKWPNIKRTCLLVDIKSKEDVLHVLQKYAPTIIFHAAAYKHVPMVEANPISGIENNFIGTKVLTDCAIEAKTPRMVIVSTDKAVNPTNVMGATKRAAEMYSLSVSTNTATAVMAVRFGNVLGSNGSVIPLFRKQIMEGGPVTVTHQDAERYFMTIPEASALILQAAAKGKAGNLFMLDMGESVKIVHLAEEMIRLSGLKPYEDIDIEIKGLRPGEKLFEELWYDGENMSKTDMEKTFLVQPHSLSQRETNTKTTNITKACQKEDAFKAVQMLKELVKEYQPAHNSPYAKLNDAGQNKKKN